MAAPNRNDGIQMLLQAEKKAADKVAAAKIRKAKRVQEAQADADKEMEFCRKEYERNYKIQEEEVFGLQNNTEAQITATTQKTLEMQNESFRLNRESTLNGLLDTVLTISPKIHINYRPKQRA
ncbi:unnamed protein product [Rodentolepis nana]|uniref:V-type proton ATPase subunit G n=1 Tax=Rodentolepis nana TaxID=102285 RepID=A0A0R3THA8_RODNA|nr:unnamed protein product [Rodentolepis nana]